MPSDPPTFSSVISASVVSLTWGSVAGVDGYKLYRRPNGVGASFALIKDTTDTSFDDNVPNYDLSDLNSGPSLADYDYKVTAYDGVGESSGVTLTANMVDITGANITAFGIKHPTYNDGADKMASYTITNTNVVTPTVGDSSKSIFETRLRGMEKYADE